MVERGASYGIMQTEQLHGHQVSVRAEGIVTRPHKAVHLYPLAGVRNARGLAQSFHSPHIEILCPAAKRLLTKQIVAERTHVAHHLRAVSRTISLRHYHHIHFLVGVAHILYFYGVCFHSHLRLPLQLCHCRVRVETVTELGVHLQVAVPFLKTNLNSFLGPWHTHHLLKSSNYFLPFRGIAILAEKWIISPAVQFLPAFGVLNQNSVIPIVKRIQKLRQRSCPAYNLLALLHTYGVVLPVARSEIVNAQSRIFKILLKLHVLSKKGTSCPENGKQYYYCNFSLHNGTKTKKSPI